MLQQVQERERPWEWLRALREDEAGYEELLRESGTLFIAAHRVASARCRASAVPSVVPTVRELRAAAREVLGEDDVTTPVPSPALLLEECAVAGLDVITTLR